MVISHTLLVAALTLGGLQAGSEDPDFIALLETGDSTVLLQETRRRPDDLRDALAHLLQRSTATTNVDERVRCFHQAEQLAQFYGRVWSDSFLIHSVARFAGLSQDERVQKLQADSLRRAGIEEYYRDGPDAAIQTWERVLGRYRALDDLPGQAAALGNIGAAYYALDQLDRALRHYTRSLQLAQAAGDLRTIGNALGNIASVHKDKGEYALAAQYYERALQERARSGDRQGQAADLNNLGLVRADLGDRRGAEEYFRRALELNRADGRDRAAADNLTNLANLSTQWGRYDEALDLYSEALELRRAKGDRLGEALDLENLGLLHVRWGDYPAALGALRLAVDIVSEIGAETWQAELRSDIAGVHAAMGQLQAALDELEHAQQAAAGDEYLLPDLTLQRAELLTELNEFERAARLYRQAKAAYKRVADPEGEAEAAEGLGYLYLASGVYGAAEEAFTRALLVQEELGDSRPVALTRLLLGDAQLAKGDTAAARDSYDQALAIHQTLGDAAGEAVAFGALADLDREVGAPAAAEALYRAGLARLEGKPATPIRWYLHRGLGLTLQGQSKWDAAAAELRAAVSQLEAVGATLRVEQRRYAYLEDKWDVFGELARVELRRGRVARAFELSEEMRARQLVDDLARGRLADGKAESRLIREEQNLRRRIDELSSQLAADGDVPSSIRDPAEAPASLDRLSEELAAARADYERLLVRIEASRPEYASLVTGATVSVSELQGLVPAGAVLIEYLVLGESSIAFVVSEDSIAAVELSLDRKTLRQLVQFFRGSVTPGSDGFIDELWRAPLRRLYRELIEPLESGGYLEDRDLLVIAPHSELHYLPFQAFLRPAENGESFLIESYDLAYVPSASAWALLARRDRSRRGGDGLLAMAPRPETLLNSGLEVRSIGRGQSRSEVLVGPSATEQRFLETAPDREIIHLATFGVLNRRNPLFSYLRLNAAGEADGRLEVHEVFGLSLAADLVVLSACETGLGSGLRYDVPAGDDWVGLVRGFLHAGARSVVASLWTVDDRATTALMEQFYAGLRAGRSATAALARAQRAMLNSDVYSSPYYWAAFGVTGGIR